MNKSKKRILVTGASGFIGTNLVPRLLETGWEVCALVHDTGLEKTTEFRELKIIEGDVYYPEKYLKNLDKIDSICHLAAFIPSDYEDVQSAETCLKVNALATLRLAEYVSHKFKGRFIYISSGNAYKVSSKSSIEEDPLYPDECATYYLTSKIVGEMYIEHLRKTKNLNAISLRVSSPYGMNMPDNYIIAHWMKNASSGKSLEVWDSGLSMVDYVYIDDVVFTIIKALTDGEPGIYNVGSGKSYSLLELAKYISDIYCENKIKICIRPLKKGARPRIFPALAIEKAKSTWEYLPLSLKDGLKIYKEKIELSLC